MNVAMPTHQSCCCNSPVQQTNTQSAESFSAVFSVTSITTLFNPWTNETYDANKSYCAEPNGMQAILQDLPNIRTFLKPWYFPDAQNHNLAYIRTVAVRIVSNTSQEQSGFLETVMNKLKAQNGIAEDNTCCCSLDKPAQANKEVDPLSEDDKKQLASLHHFAKDHHIDTRHVNTVATRLATDKITARNNQQEAPVFGKTYFEQSIEGMSVWKNTIQGEKIVEHLKAFFA